MQINVITISEKKHMDTETTFEIPTSIEGCIRK